MPDFNPLWKIEAIQFHTHPNEDLTPSDKDYEFANFAQSHGAKVKTIVVTQLGFCSFGNKPGIKVFYGWYEI
jgi:DNA repair protein RadC